MDINNIIKTICPICCSDKFCLQDKDNNTGIISYVCYKCGMSSTSKMTTDNNIEEKQSQIVKNFKFFDDITNTYWAPFPLEIAMKDYNIILLPTPDIEEGYQWSIIKLNSNNNEHESIKIFSRYQFKEAIEFLGGNFEGIFDN